ncbi:hypothetical protein [Janibacter melonis]|uniref:hypothetical protein n=1 Tax=Janibacter melonis TaxID=262209 RepID=UPI0017493657|nr:hypothetical protein [Janibacter melonis]
MLTIAHLDAPIGDVLRYSVIDGGLFVRADVTWDGQTAPMWIAYEDVLIEPGSVPMPFTLDVPKFIPARGGLDVPDHRPGEPVPYSEHDPEGRWAS